MVKEHARLLLDILEKHSGLSAHGKLELVGHTQIAEVQWDTDNNVFVPTNTGIIRQLSDRFWDGQRQLAIVKTYADPPGIDTILVDVSDKTPTGLAVLLLWALLIVEGSESMANCRPPSGYRLPGVCAAASQAVPLALRTITKAVNEMMESLNNGD